MDQKNKQLRDFIELLLENKMSEKEIQDKMESLGIEYIQDPAQRWKTLFVKLNPLMMEPNL